MKWNIYWRHPFNSNNKNENKQTNRFLPPFPPIYAIKRTALIRERAKKKKNAWKAQQIQATALLSWVSAIAFLHLAAIEFSKYANEIQRKTKQKSFIDAQDPGIHALHRTICRQIIKNEPKMAKSWNGIVRAREYVCGSWLLGGRLM